ncbi:MAG: ZIP family metal transporter [Rhodospirillaceae bacterium]|nr:ZIP family metal transporter [Rhodospirillaceae bacterium]
MVAGLATSLGALPIFLGASRRRPAEVLMLASAAGVMLGATVFSLILPALALNASHAGPGWPAALLTGAGILLGALAIWGLHAAIPHQHFVKGREGAAASGLSRQWLFVLAITLHNVPEGLSVGVAYGTRDIGDGLSITLGIGLQNLPEGLAVAAAAASEGLGRWRAFAIASLTGLVEPAGGLVGAAAVSLSDRVLPWALAGAAGAMLYVVSGEVIPETHRSGRETGATLSLVAGFVLMMLLDVGLG